MVGTASIGCGASCKEEIEQANAPIPHRKSYLARRLELPDKCPLVACSYRNWACNSICLQDRCAILAQCQTTRLEREVIVGEDGMLRERCNLQQIPVGDVVGNSRGMYGTGVGVGGGKLEGQAVRPSTRPRSSRPQYRKLYRLGVIRNTFRGEAAATSAWRRDSKCTSAANREAEQ